MVATLYDRDLQQWIQQTIQQLQAQDFDSLDIEHLIEELVDLGEVREKCAEKQFDPLVGAFATEKRVSHSLFFFG
jgi:hypothetical protein